MYTHQQHPLLNSHNEDREEFKLNAALMYPSTASGSSSSSMMEWWNFAYNTTRSRSESSLYEHAPSDYYPTPAFEGVYPGPQSSYSHLPYEFNFSDYRYPAQFLADNSQWQPTHADTKPRVYVDESPSPEIASSPSFRSWPSTHPPSLEFNSNSWNEMLISSAFADGDPSDISSLSCTSYVRPHPPPPPSPSLSSSSSVLSSASSSQTLDHGHPSPEYLLKPAPLPSLHPGPAKQKSCSHCTATTTPLWRRSPTTHLPLCNACGLYLQQRNKMRPAALIACSSGNEDDHDSEELLDANADGTPLPRCAHCRTHKTSVWRRGASGEKLCNACGVYRRLRGRERPLELRGRRIRPRCKHPKKEVEVKKPNQKVEVVVVGRD
ncbi:gata zinc finger domain-containing protein [Favolaschia claudopus]|uniref:Gata zinc finger domain-containing protein n=1 Tax=Favolaschia claudopus TaxID=2862362 RepID=A0AAV9ZRT9_9AGAR